MRDVAVVLGVLSAASALWAVVASILMGAWLTRHGVRVNWILFRALMPWYVHRYKAMTREIEGEVGPLFPHFVVPINLALLFAVAALIAMAATRG
jgi:hypothetical protein